MRTEALRFVGTVVLLWLSFFKPCRASGSLEIKLKSYESTCEDNTFLFGIFTTPCDAVFEICIDEPGTVDFQSCAYDHQTSTVHENQNQVTFYEQIGQGISNPRIIHFDNFQNPRVMFSVKIKDDEFIMSTEHLATLSQTFSFTPASGKSQAGWTSSYMLKVDGDGYRYRINFQYRAYCDAYYYTGQCDVYCRATDDASGHYTCHPVTGQKQCFPGWEGENCDIDINECTQAPCHNNAECVNQQGTYECVCSNGYSGKNCGVVSSQCASAPCQHGGTCSGDTWSYTCSCPSEWTGQNCNTMKDFCESNPCQNYGTCQSTLGGYVCNCTLGTKGKNCETEVNACDSLPCQHGSTCKRKPAGEYECGCKEEYEGRNCEVLKNPCDSAPCLNSGICGRVSHDTYTCLCLRGWEGKRCQIRSIVSNGTAERQEGKESSSKIPFLPIILGCMSGLILLLIILLLLAFKKRRRQKASTSSESGNVPPFASLDAIVSRNVPMGCTEAIMGYPNLLYDQTNASNASLERSRGPGSFLRPPMPLPKPRPSGSCGGGGCKEDCYPGKVGGMAGEEEEEEEEGGAVGGVRGVTVLQRDGGVTWKKGKGEAERHRTTSTGPTQNDYADFAELQRDSIAARRETAQDDPSSQEDFEDLAQEDDYQELNDLHLHQLKDSADSSLGKSNA